MSGENNDVHILSQLESIKLNENQSDLNLDEVQKHVDNQDEKIYPSDNNQLNQHRNDIVTQQTNDNVGIFYEKSKEYWSTIPATVNGMLGGFGDISAIDIKGSHEFLKNLYKKYLLLKQFPSPGKQYALDCGAGIGRITKYLLIHHFQKVDIVEQEKKFADKAREYINSNDRLGEIYNTRLQDFVPELKKYDIIWCQWVLGYLNDVDLKHFFQRIKNSICQNGLLIVKENVTSSNNLEIDECDSSVTRSLNDLEKIIELSGFEIIKKKRQINFPKGLYPVYLFACKPNSYENVTDTLVLSK